MSAGNLHCRCCRHLPRSSTCCPSDVVPEQTRRVLHCLPLWSSLEWGSYTHTDGVRWSRPLRWLLRLPGHRHRHHQNALTDPVGVDLRETACTGAPGDFAARQRQRWCSAGGGAPIVRLQSPPAAGASWSAIIRNGSAITGALSSLTTFYDDTGVQYDQTYQYSIVASNWGQKDHQHHDQAFSRKSTPGRFHAICGDGLCQAPITLTLDASSESSSI